MLDAALDELAAVTSLEDVQRTVRTTERRLVQADVATFVLRDVERRAEVLR